MKTLNYLIVFITLIINVFNSMAQERVVLIEQFTNSGCPPCAASTPPVLQYVDDNTQTVVAIAYHTSFPYNDSMYFENPSESNQRVAFYNVSGVPHSIVDGNNYSGSSSSFIGIMPTTISNRNNIIPNYSISTIESSINGNMLGGLIEFKSLFDSNTNDTLRAYIVVVEKNVLKNSYAASPGANTETEYKYVMRKILPNSSGSALNNRNLNGLDTISYSWNMQHIKSISEVRVVAFVQNIITKEIYQSVSINPSLISNIKILGEQSNEVNIYPNPNQGSFYLETRNDFKGQLKIMDLHGKQELIQNSSIIANESKRITLENKNPGVYFLTLTNEKGLTTTRILIK